MHRIAFQLGHESVFKMTEYLKQGLQCLCDGQAPSAAAPARLGLIANACEIDAGNFVGNPNLGTRGRGSRKRKRSGLETSLARRRTHSRRNIFTQLRIPGGSVSQRTNQGGQSSRE